MQQAATSSKVQVDEIDKTIIVLHVDAALAVAISPMTAESFSRILLVNDKVILLVYLVMLTNYTENRNVYRE